jgi:hypothetical protein
LVSHGEYSSGVNDGFGFGFGWRLGRSSVVEVVAAHWVLL